jgi:NAD(P)H dehydrogenase (quinone)
MIMTRVLVLYYSSYGHIEKMATAVAEGVREAGAEATIKRVLELVPEDVAKKSGFKLDQAAPIATVAELPDYDAIILGDALWQYAGTDEKLSRRVFSSTATQHGGQESTILSTHTVLLHQGMVIVGLPYSFQGQMGVKDVTGGSPYGATTISDGDGSRQPSDNELAGARFQGRHVAQIAAKLRAA